MHKARRSKFLVADPAVLDAHQGFPIMHGYLVRENPPVEVRTFGSFAFLTVKDAGKSLVRRHFEYPIPLEDALAMLESHCAPRLVSKTRHLVPHGRHTFEVDAFGGRLAGLVIAEIALEEGAAAFAPPPWLGAEITGDARFDDFALACLEAPPEMEGVAEGVV